MIHLTDEALKQHIKETEAMLLKLRQERMARELRLAEKLLPACTAKAQQYFGANVKVTTDTDEYDCQAMLVIEMPWYPLYDEQAMKEDAFFADPEVLEMIGPGPFIHIRFV